MYIPEGTISNENPLPLLDDIDEVQRKKKLEDEIPIKGKLKTVVVMARGLTRADQAKGGLSDPYAKIEYPDKKSVTTKAIKSTVNPVWNFEHPHIIDITRGVNKQ
jgi:Ca2+-dependent lipid-binding protein